MSNNSFKIKNSAVLTPKDLTTLVSPEAGEIACDINDNNKIKRYDALSSAWVEVGSGAASLDTAFQLVGDDFSTWTKGNNASFLGGGTLAGTFAQNTSTPFNSAQSYIYTQAAGSLNDYISSPVKSIPRKFRGSSNVIYFPFSYNGNSNEITVVLYDVTNSTVIVGSNINDGFGIQASNGGITKYAASFVIPASCASVRVGFQVKTANSGKVLEFDDIEVGQDNYIQVLPNISDWENYSATVTNLNAGTSPTLSYRWRRVGDSMEVRGIIQAGGTGMSISGLVTVSLPSGYLINSNKLALNQEQNLGSVSVLNAGVQRYSGSVNYFSTSAVEFVVATNFIDTATPTAGWFNAPLDSLSFTFTVPIQGWTSTSPTIVSSAETFSTDTASLTYASSAAYTLSTLQNAPVGTYITFTYASGTNTRTQTTTRPTQTDADMNTNGMLLYTRAFNANSTAAQPAAIAIQIGKGLKGKTLDLYKNAGKSIQGSLDYYVNGTQVSGVYYKEYNESTGILIVDLGVADGATTSHIIAYSDITGHNLGYLVINASKNPALTGLGLNRVAARAVQSSGQSIPNNMSTTLIWDSNKTFDTHNSLNTATGTFTAPETGYYKLNSGFLFNTTSWSAGAFLQLKYVINGATQVSLDRKEIETTRNGYYNLHGSDLVYLIKNDTVVIQIIHNRGLASSIQPDSTFNYFSIVKVSI